MKLICQSLQDQHLNQAKTKMPKPSKVQNNLKVDIAQTQQTLYLVVLHGALLVIGLFPNID